MHCLKFGVAQSARSSKRRLSLAKDLIDSEEPNTTTLFCRENAFIAVYALFLTDSKDPKHTLFCHETAS